MQSFTEVKSLSLKKFKTLKFANESFVLNQELNQIHEAYLTEKNLMPAIQKIVSDKQAQKVGGVMLDMFTASVIAKAYDQVNDSNKAKNGKGKHKHSC